MWWALFGLMCFLALVALVAFFACRRIDEKLARVEERLEQIIERGDA